MAPEGEYQEFLKQNLNLVERVGDAFSGVDDRLDFTNKLLIRILDQLGGRTPSPVTALGASPASVGNKQSFLTNQKDVVTAGTAVQLATYSVLIPDGFSLTIIAKPGNTGYIYLGSSKSEAENAAGRFDGLSAGLAVSLRISDTSIVWVNSDTDGDGISWIVER